MCLKDLLCAGRVAAEYFSWLQHSNGIVNCEPRFGKIEKYRVHGMGGNSFKPTGPCRLPADVATCHCYQMIHT